MRRIDSEMDLPELAHKKQNEFTLDGLIAAVAAFHLHLSGNGACSFLFAARGETEPKFPQTSSFVCRQF